MRAWKCETASAAVKEKGNKPDEQVGRDGYRRKRTPADDTQEMEGWIIIRYEIFY